MTRLHDLYDTAGQSPWIDNLTRGSVLGGGLQQLVDRGIRGVTSNPTIFQKAMSGSSDYDEQFRTLVQSDSVDAAFWRMAMDDIRGACGVLKPVYDASKGGDGYVSLEVSPKLAHDTDGTIDAARSIHQQLDQPNLLVKIPGTEEGVPAIQQMISEGRNINVTLIFSLPRYGEVIEAYLSGLEAFAATGGDLGTVHSVASFFVSRVDTEVDRRLDNLGDKLPAADHDALAGRAAVAQAKLAYQLFESRFSGPRWEALAGAGAHRQRPLWASTSTKNPAYPDLLYVDSLVGPHTVNTMPDATIDAFLDHGTVERTIDIGVDDARADLARLSEVGIEMADVAQVLEDEGVASFAKSFEELDRVPRSQGQRPGRRSEVGVADAGGDPTVSGVAPPGRPAGAGVDNPLRSGQQGSQPAASRARQAPPGVLVVFGASGDLTARKLLPALEQLSRRRLLPGAFAVLGVARTEMTDEQFRAEMHKAVPEAGPGWSEIVARSRYVAGAYDGITTFEQVRAVLDQMDERMAMVGNRTYYLATVPAVFADVAAGLGAVGLNRPSRPEQAVRLVIEKPFGRDLPSARQLDAALHQSFDEEQIYRIDHYLGKETVQNVMALRFANAMFEPLWNRSFIDHVQITVAESLGVEKRGGFYETAGALRDIVQNHVMQVLALTLMEPPGSADSRGIRDEKVKALRAVVIPTPADVRTDVVRAQYDSGWSEGRAVPGYREEPGVAANSTTETYVAMKLKVDNWRWAGVPFYIRTGKRLPKRVTEVALQFHGVPHLLFDRSQTAGLHPNTLVMRIQPDEGVTVRFGAKVPGQAFQVRDVLMDFSYGAAFLEAPPDAYERLLVDAMVGDPTLFIRSDEVDQAWQVVEPLLETWASGGAPMAGYAAGTWGPRQAEQLIGRDGRQWRQP